VPPRGDFFLNRPMSLKLSSAPLVLKAISSGKPSLRHRKRFGTQQARAERASAKAVALTRFSFLALSSHFQSQLISLLSSKLVTRNPSAN
jgi:hypothetical protein